MKRTSGHIYQTGKKRVWYIRYKRDGVERRLRLLDSNGMPVSGKKEAEAAASRLMLRIREEDKAERARLLIADFRDANEAAKAAELSERNLRGALENGWALFMQCPSRPKCCRMLKGSGEPPPRTNARNYWAYLKRFVDWCRGQGKHLYSDVTPDDASAYMETFECAAGTYNKNRMFLSLFYTVLIGEKKISCDNPFARIQTLDGDCNSKEPLSKEQVASLLDAADGEVKLLFALGYFTGLRLGDCCTLKWSEVDFVSGVINRLPRKTGGRAKDKLLAMVKVGISPFLSNMLSFASRDGEYVLPQLAEMYLGNRETLITTRIRAVFKKAGIEMHDERGVGGRAVVRYGFHSLRYSYISHNAEAGTPMGVIQRNAGHSNRMMTEHYLKISDEAARRYADALQLPEMSDASENEKALPDDRAMELQRLCRKIPPNKLDEAIASMKRLLAECDEG